MKNFKNVNAVWLFVLTLILIGIIGTTTFAEEPSILKSIIDKGIMTVGVPRSENWSWINPTTGKWEGIAIDIMDYLAERIDVKVEYKDVDWQLFPMELENGSIDIYAGTAHYTVPRAMKVAFPYPIFWKGVGFVTLKENADKYKTLEDINKKGVKIAIGMGTYEDQYAQYFYPKATALRMKSGAYNDLVEAVKAGQADLAAFGHTDAWQLCENYDWLVMPIKTIVSPGMQSFPVKYGDWEWFHFIDSFCFDMVESGLVDKIVQKWFPNMPKEIRDAKP